ncbi:MAG: PAS domain S-box protein, partial [Spirochaetota bacterium]
MTQHATTILLVEDDLVIALAHQRRLEHHGYTVLTAPSGDAAIETVLRGERVDLILMDIDLGPGIDGTEAAATILRSVRVPIVFLTSHAEQEMVERVKGITRYGYVLKSSGEFVLLEAIGMALELFKAHEQLERSRDEYRAVVRLSGEIVVRIGVDNRWTFVNTRAAEFYGKRADDLVGRDFFDFVHPEDRSRTLNTADLMHTSRGPIWQFVNRQRSADGWRLVEWSSEPIYGPDGTLNGYRATGRDITEREQSRRRFELMGRALESTGNGIVFANLDGSIEYTNPAVRAMWGYERPEEVHGRSIAEFTDDPDRLLALFATAIETGQVHGDFEGRRRDGSAFPAVLYASRVCGTAEMPDQIMGSVLDVSEQKRIEADLRTFEQAADSTDEVIVALDATGRVTFANSRFLTNHGLSRSEVVGQVAWHIHPDDPDRDKLREHIARCLEGETVSLEVSRIFPGRGRRYASVTYSPIRDAERAIVGAIGILKDVTSQRLREEEIREQLTRSELLGEIARADLAGRSVDETIGEVTRRLGSHFRGCRAGYATLGPDGALTVQASVQPPTMSDTRGRRYSLEHAQAWLESLRAGDTVGIADVRHDPRVHGLRHALEEAGIAGFISAPLVLADDLVGVLYVDAPTVRAWHEREIELVVEVGRYLSLFLKARSAKDKLAKHEREYRRLAENADDVIYRFELRPEKRLSYVNQAAERVSGYSPREYYADPDLVFRVAHPDDRHLLLDAVTDPERPREPAMVRWLHRDGAVRWTEHTFVPIAADGTVTAFEGVARDVTERERAKQALQAKTDELEHVYNLLPDIVGVVSPDGRIVRINEASSRVLGWSPAELEGTSFRGIVHPDDEHRTFHRLAELEAGESCAGLQNRYRCRDGSHRWLEWRLAKDDEGFVHAAARDITERIRA